MRRSLATTIFILLLTLAANASNVQRAEVGLSSLPLVDENLQLRLALTVENQSDFQIREITINYKPVNTSIFQRQQLLSSGFRYFADVDLAGYAGRTIEYYFDIEYYDGQHQAYPFDAPSQNLYQLSLQQLPESRDDGVVIVSPEPGENVLTDEFLMTVSFFRIGKDVDPARIKVLFDDIDITQNVRVFDDFLTYTPRKIPSGKHRLRIDFYSRSGRILARKDWQFSASERRGPAPVTDIFAFSGRMFAETRNEDLVSGARQENYSTAGLQLRGGNQRMGIGGRILISNQEKRFLQPVNRYSMWAEAKFWDGRRIRISGGDTYPELNPFLMRNIFVRGFHAELFLKYINLNVVRGYNQRGFDGAVRTDTSGVAVDTSRGSFQRDIWAINSSIGARENFQLGLTVAKAKDRGENVILGPDPEESLGIGSELFLAYFNNRLVVEGSYNISFYNSNISDGEDVPLETLRSEGLDINETFYNRLDGLMTRNRNLLFEPAEAYRGLVRINFLSNTLSAEYRYIQEEFQTLTQPFMLRDIKGLTISDNVRLFRNQLFLNLRYQQLQDNLTNSKTDVTDIRNLGVNVSIFPLQALPSLTIGYQSYSRENDSNADSSLALPENNVTNAVNISTSYAFDIASLSNRLTLNLLNYNRNDQTSVGVDNLSNTATLVLQTRYTFPLRTSLEFNFQQSDNYLTNVDRDTTSFAMNTFGASAQYTFDGLTNTNDALSLGIRGQYGIASDELSLAQGNSPRLNSITDYNRMHFSGRIIYDSPRLGKLSLNGDVVEYSGDRSFRDVIFGARYTINF